MLDGFKGVRGWLTLAALVPVVFVLTYLTQPEVRRAAFWGDAWRDQPLDERVHLLPAAAVPSLRAMMSGIAPATNAEYVVQDLQAAIDSLPESVRRLITDHLIGVYLVEGLGGSKNAHNLGMALEVSGLWRQHVGTVILIDRDETDMRANQAMSGLEYVPSGDYRGVTVQARLARRDADTRSTTLRYVLLHELGHLIDYEQGITPARFSYGASREGCGFTCLSWLKPDRHRYSRRIDTAMRSIHNGQLDAYVSALPETFKDLAQSNFPSLYAATQPQEDFAESFAQYVHTVLLGQPWDLTLRVNGTIKAQLGACFLDRRCPGKKAYFDALLAGGR
jgi:hypothetical protein